MQPVLERGSIDKPLTFDGDLIYTTQFSYQSVHLIHAIFQSNWANYSGNQTNAHIHNYIPVRKQQSCILLQATLKPQNKAFSLKKRPRVASNDLGGCRDQAYHFQHQKLALYAQSREPFDTGHGRSFRTITKMASGGLKMTSEAAGTMPIIFNIKRYPCMPKEGSHSIQGMAGHSGQTRKQTNKFLFALLV